jgi:murein DD-endopeptidase MepM/ murein hydrolase activator NlpD
MFCKFPKRKIFFASLLLLTNKQNTRTSRLKNWLTTAYRLVILNDETFGERFSLRLSPLGIIIGLSAITIVMTSLVISLVALTPLREYIPGYGTVTERKELLKMSIRADSMERAMAAKESYINSLLHVFGDLPDETTAKPKKDSLAKYSNVKSDPSKTDISFRKDMEESISADNASNYQAKPKLMSDVVFYSPVKGMVTTSFNVKENHYGVDVVTKADETIKAPLDGTIIYTGFTVQDGYIIQIQHSNNIMTVFKHNARLLKKTGERVKAGEVIANIGNTGTLSKGNHMHFELWYNGIPVNPEDFVSF